MAYTFYGDLLGISGYYRVSAQQAYIRLNEFYNTTFSCLSQYSQYNPASVQVNMFSDSLLIWGDNNQEILMELVRLYLRLISRRLLLRGALVSGKIHIDPRMTLENFTKMLPQDDSLARAVGLAQMQKGARLLVENSMAENLLVDCGEWLTQEGYVGNLKSHIALDSIKRRVSLTPDNKTHEILYFWVPTGIVPDNLEYTPERIVEQLEELSKNFTDEISIHYKETLGLFQRSLRRKKFTEKNFNRWG